MDNKRLQRNVRAISRNIAIRGFVCTLTGGLFLCGAAQSAASAPAEPAAYEPKLISVSIAGVSRVRLQRDGYELVTGTVADVKVKSSKQTVVIVSTRKSGRRSIEFTHPPGLKLPFSKGMEFEVEIGERASGFTRTFRPYAAVRSNGRTILGVNADKMYESDPVFSRGKVTTDDPSAVMQLHEAQVKIAGESYDIPPNTWTRLTSGQGKYIVFQVMESIRPDSPPPRSGTGFTARNDYCFVWQTDEENGK